MAMAIQTCWTCCRSDRACRYLFSLVSSFNLARSSCALTKRGSSKAYENAVVMSSRPRYSPNSLHASCRAHLNKWTQSFQGGFTTKDTTIIGGNWRCGVSLPTGLNTYSTWTSLRIYEEEVHRNTNTVLYVRVGTSLAGRARELNGGEVNCVCRAHDRQDRCVGTL